MLGLQEFVLRARIDAASVEAWVEAGWLVPRQSGAGRSFSEPDLARACLIRDLRDDLGINDEGIPVVLDLLDQVHGLRLALHRLAGALRTLPEPVRQDAVAALHSLMEAAEAGLPAGQDRP